MKDQAVAGLPRELTYEVNQGANASWVKFVTLVQDADDGGRVVSDWHFCWL